MEAADWETLSMSLPSMTISSCYRKERERGSAPNERRGRAKGTGVREGEEEGKRRAHLDVGRLADGNTLQHRHVTNNLLSQEVANLDRILGIVDDDIDGEMGVNQSHLVGEPIGDTLEHVLDARADGAQARDVLASSVPHDEADLPFLLGRVGSGGDHAHRHVGVVAVLWVVDARVDHSAGGESGGRWG